MLNAYPNRSLPKQQQINRSYFPASYPRTWFKVSGFCQSAILGAILFKLLPPSFPQFYFAGFFILSSFREMTSSRSFSFVLFSRWEEEVVFLVWIWRRLAGTEKKQISEQRLDAPTKSSRRERCAIKSWIGIFKLNIHSLVYDDRNFTQTRKNDQIGFCDKK